MQPLLAVNPLIPLVFKDLPRTPPSSIFLFPHSCHPPHLMLPISPLPSTPHFRAVRMHWMSFPSCFTGHQVLSYLLSFTGSCEEGKNQVVHQFPTKAKLQVSTCQCAYKRSFTFFPRCKA